MKGFFRYIKFKHARLCTQCELKQEDAMRAKVAKTMKKALKGQPKRVYRAMKREWNTFPHTKRHEMYLGLRMAAGEEVGK